MNCPKCKSGPMNSETYNNVEIDRCPKCKGLFFDEGELDSILDARAGAAADGGGFNEMADQLNMATGACPRCEQVELKPYVGPAGVRIDRCPQCEGVFLDQGELKTLQMWKTLQKS